MSTSLSHPSGRAALREHRARARKAQAITDWLVANLHAGNLRGYQLAATIRWNVAHDPMALARVVAMFPVGLVARTPSDKTWLVVADLLDNRKD